MYIFILQILLQLNILQEKEEKVMITELRLGKMTTQEIAE